MFLPAFMETLRYSSLKCGRKPEIPGDRMLTLHPLPAPFVPLCHIQSPSRKAAPIYLANSSLSFLPEVVPNDLTAPPPGNGCLVLDSNLCLPLLNYSL